MSDFFKDLSTWIPLVAVIVPLFVKVIKYYSVGESDFVYLTKVIPCKISRILFGFLGIVLLRGNDDCAETTR